MGKERSISQWCRERLSGRAGSADGRRRARVPDLLAPWAGAPSPDADSAFDPSWFESSRALAQGLCVTEHAAGLEELLNPPGACDCRPEP
jgi:hypothetical protein